MVTAIFTVHAAEGGGTPIHWIAGLNKIETIIDSETYKCCQQNGKNRNDELLSLEKQSKQCEGGIPEFKMQYNEQLAFFKYDEDVQMQYKDLTQSITSSSPDIIKDRFLKIVEKLTSFLERQLILKDLKDGLDSFVKLLKEGDKSAVAP